MSDSAPARREPLAPVFLLGAARSGTSLLYKTLCLHPEAGWISNWVARYPRLPQIAALNRLGRRLPRHQVRVWFGGSSSNAYVYSGHRSTFERMFPMPVEGEPLFRRCGIGEAPAERPTTAQLQSLRRAFTTVRRFGGGRVLVCKRIANNRRVPALVEAFREARFVEIVRDGRAVAYSLSRVDWWEDSVVSWYGDTPRRWAAEGGDPWELRARNWVEELADIERGLSAVDARRVLRIHYEAFVSEPLETLRGVAAFVGLPPDEGWLRRVGQLRFPDRNEAWPAALGPDTVRRLELIQRAELARHGYG